MKYLAYVYWGATLILSAMMAAAGTMYFIAEGPAQTFAALGFPDYFRVELGVAKLLGAAALAVPLPRAVKEWAYAGFAITFVSAIIAHASSGDPPSALIAPLVALGLLAVSYWAYRRRLDERLSEKTTPTESESDAARA